jgi:hypothetical protein
MLYNVLLYHGRRTPSFLRTQKRWQLLIPLLMDHVLVDIDPDIEDTFSGLISTSGPSTGWKGLAIPIEARLRSLSVRLLYEVCRSSKMSIGDLSLSPHWLSYYTPLSFASQECLTTHFWTSCLTLSSRLVACKTRLSITPLSGSLSVFHSFPLLAV